MRMILSPAKRMRVDTDTIEPRGNPVFLERTKQILEWLRSLQYEEQKRIWACNDSIAAENRERCKRMELEHGLTPALLAYEGIQYQYMAPAVFEERELEYVQEHLRILSGFYGVLKPLDGVAPYRLEMQAQASVCGYKSLYDFWGDSLFRDVMDESRVIINLASREYSKCIEKYVRPEDLYITCVFGEIGTDGARIVQKGVYAKMARGEMVRYLANIQAEALEQVKEFCGSGYTFSQEHSTEHTFVFLRAPSNTGKRVF